MCPQTGGEGGKRQAFLLLTVTLLQVVLTLKKSLSMLIMEDRNLSGIAR